MSQSSLKPLIVQSDLTILLETNSPLYEQARDKISLFAELIKSPEFVHTYKITPLSLWNAASAGVKFDEIVETLKTFSRYPVPENVFTTIKEVINRYGKLKILKGENEKFLLFSEDDILLTEIFYNKKIRPYIEERIDRNHLLIKSPFRGHIKQALIGIGFPVEDIAGYKDGDPLEINMVEHTRKTNKPFRLYPYQEEAVKIFYANNSPRGGSGVIVLPCGAGKTIVGLKILTLLKTHTLILVTNATAAEQWKEELLDKTDIDESMIGQYYAECKEIKPITIATYQIIVYRKKKGEEFIHYDIFYKKNWGFIIYDEVHLLPAPVFRITAELQSKRRLGLTATLVREDGKEADVFALIGPKKYDVPWKELEKQGWIAKAICTEIRIPLPENLKYKYAVSPPREQFRIASTNPLKFKVVEELVKLHYGDKILIIGQYIEQLKEIAEKLNAPFIYGKTPNSERDKLYKEFKKGDLNLLVVSKVANYAIDLPDANVAIQISGTFGSRQEEAQRLGRILRPKRGDNQAHFYTIVTDETREREFAFKRQLFLTEQGYKYEIKSYWS